MHPVATHISPYSGSWYPGIPSELNLLLDRIWKDSETRCCPYSRPGGLGFVVPHAGLMYSGTVSAAAYRHIQELQPERVVLLGFAHRGGPSGVAIPDIKGFETPLGTVRVDRATVLDLVTSPDFQLTRESALCDHSVEIQLPLLQRAAPNATVVPLYVREPGRGAAEVLAKVIQPGTAVVASSDFTHFGESFHFRPFPVDEDTRQRLRVLDHEVIDAAGSLDRNLVFQSLRKTHATVCGFEPIGLLLETLHLLENEREIFQEELDYQTSGEITGDFHHSVSYAALGFFPYDSFLLGEAEQRLLLEAAHRTLQNYQQTGNAQPVKPEDPPPCLMRNSGAFVTLRKKGELRGCIGRHVSLEPLAHTVPELTLAAALDDTRFDPVEPAETGIEVEISVLSPMKLVSDPGKFRINEHGVFLEADERRGLLLPQVATARNWDAPQFLSALAHKMGVSPRVYSDPQTRFFLFRAQVFE